DERDEQVKSRLEHAVELSKAFLDADFPGLNDDGGLGEREQHEPCCDRDPGDGMHDGPSPLGCWTLTIPAALAHRGEDSNLRADLSGTLVRIDDPHQIVAVD